MIYHFGGKSGGTVKDAKGMDVKMEEVKSWFEGREAKILDHID